MSEELPWGTHKWRMHSSNHGTVMYLSLETILSSPVVGFFNQNLFYMDVCLLRSTRNLRKRELGDTCRLKMN